jgi:hypothetical protein
MTRRKKRSFDKARRTKKKSDIARYRKLKSATPKKCRKAFKDYVENIIDPDLSSNPKRFWSFTKSKRCESTGLSPSFVEASFLPPRHLFYCAVNPRLTKSG